VFSEKYRHIKVFLKMVMEKFESCESVAKDSLKLIEEIELDHLGAREENLNLRSKIIEQMEPDSGSCPVKHENALYDQKDKKHETPYCITCWDYENKKIRLMQDGEKLICGICDIRHGGYKR
jgi:hypothetical protein